MDLNLVIWTFVLMPEFGRSCIQPNFVWLTYSYSIKLLKLECYVKYLKLPLNIECNHIERGHCSSIYPSPKCYAYDLNETIKQNLTTNITTYTVPISDPESLNGQWKCLHGQDSSSCSINISTNIHQSDDDIPLKGDIHVKNDDGQCYIYVFLYEISAFVVSSIATVLCFQCKTIRDSKVQILTAPCRFVDHCADRVSHISNQYISKSIFYTALKSVYGLLLCVFLFTPLISYQENTETCEGTIQSVITGTVLGSLVVLLFHKGKASTECVNTISNQDEEDGGGGTNDRPATNLINGSYEAVTTIENDQSTECMQKKSNQGLEVGEGKTIDRIDVHGVKKLLYETVAYQINEDNIPYSAGDEDKAESLKTTGLTKRKMALQEMVIIWDTFGQSHINLTFLPYFHLDSVCFKIDRLRQFNLGF